MAPITIVIRVNRFSLIANSQFMAVHLPLTAVDQMVPGSPPWVGEVV